MQDLINRLAAAVNIDPATAEKALSTLLSLIQNHGDRGKVAELFAMLPGASQLADAGAASGGGGGLMGMLGSSLGGSLGGGMAALAKLQATGLDMNQIKALGAETLAYAKEKAGPELVQQVAKSIPGLSDYV